MGGFLMWEQSLRFLVGKKYYILALLIVSGV
jgi:hypothetical protein